MIGILSAILFLSASGRLAAQWVLEERESGLLLLDGADSVLFYQRAAKSLNGQYARAHYLHPVYSLHNTVLTEDFPEDHLHHRGIFWAWHQNFVGDKSVGDAWALEDFSWEVRAATAEQRPDARVLHTDVSWKSPLWLDGQGAQQPFVREKTDITVHKSAQNYRIIDFRIELQALEDSLMIGGSEDEKGYSGFSWRIPLPEDLSFMSEQGKVTPQNEAIPAGPWMNISGDLDGRPGREGVAVISHPANPGHPHPWILRSSGSMQNAAFPGREKFLIAQDAPLVLRYRLIVYDGTLPDDLIHRLSAYDSAKEQALRPVGF